MKNLTSVVLKEARTSANITQLDMAKKMGYRSSQIISNWERGVGPFPLRQAKIFCRITGFNPRDLMKAKVQDYEKRIERYFIQPEKKVQVKKI